jgi:hypothetical protein
LPQTGVSVPYEFHRDELYGQIAVTRSFGVALKHNLQFGIESTRSAYRATGMGAQPAAVVSEFESYLPTSDTRISPFVQIHGYENRYQRALNVESLALQEDFQLGAETWLRVYPASESVGSSRTLLGVFSGAGYSLPVLDGLAQAYVGSNIELSDTHRSDAEVLVGGRVVGPNLGFGRLVLDGFVLDRYRNYLNPLEALGGTGRLRGYRPSAFVGPNVTVFNAELRSRSIEILSVMFGVVAFYDVGDAFRSFSTVSLRHGAGAGLRVLLPQLDRTVFRIDLGVPLNPTDPQADLTVVVRFQQAFGVPDLAPASVRRTAPTAGAAL